MNCLASIQSLVFRIHWYRNSFKVCRPCEASSGRAGTSTEPGAASEEAESSLPVVEGLKVISVSDTVTLAAVPTGGADCGSPTPITTACSTCGSLIYDDLVPTSDLVTEIDALPLTFPTHGAPNPLKFDPKIFTSKILKISKCSERAHVKEFLLSVDPNAKC